MSQFANAEEHAANPPESWTVARAGRRWTLAAAGAVLDSFATRRDAEAARVGGWLVNLYAKESRWYAGEPVTGWKPYAPMPSSEDSAALRAEVRRVVRHFQHYTSEQRANHAASHRLGYRQRQAVGSFFYTHPDVPGIAYTTRGAAARAGLAVVQNARRAQAYAAKFAADTIREEPPRPLAPSDDNLTAVLAGCVLPPAPALFDAIRAAFAALVAADEAPAAEPVVSGWARVS